MVVAWLPGSHGAAVVPVADLSKPLRVVLPPDLRAAGRVTVGEAAPTGRAAQIRVRAASEGRDRLDDLLSVEAMAQEDGSFELAGLTPGRYRIQAALDDLWLSDTLAVEVKDKDLGPLTLAIGAPGTAVRLKFVNQFGKPRPGLEVQLYPRSAIGQDKSDTHDKRLGPLGAQALAQAVGGGRGGRTVRAEFDRRRLGGPSRSDVARRGQAGNRRPRAGGNAQRGQNEELKPNPC